MEPAGDHPSRTRRRHAVYWPAIFLDAGYLLLISGGTLSLAALFPGARPLLPAGLLLALAVVLFPVRQRLHQRVRPVAPAAPDRSAAAAEAACAAPAAIGDDPAPLAGLWERIQSASDLDVLLELLAAELQRRVPAASLRVALAAEQSDAWAYLFYSENGVRRGEREGVWLPSAGELTGEVLRGGHSLVTADYSAACRERNLPERESSAAWAGFPLSAGAARIGALVLVRETPFSESEQTLAKSVAAIAGPAVAKANLEREVQHRAALLSALVHASRRVLGAADPGRLSEVLLSGARELFPAEAHLLLLPHSAGGWRAEGFYPPLAEAIPLSPGHPFVKPGAGDRLPVTRRLAEDDPLRKVVGSRRTAFRWAVSLPLRRREKISGWIVFWNPQSGLPPSDAEESVLNEYAAVAADALQPRGPSTASGPAETALAEELTSLSQLDQELNSAADPSQALAIMLDWALRYADASAGLAAVRVQDEYEVAAVRGYPDGSGPREKENFPLTADGFAEFARSEKAVRRCALGRSPAALLPGGRTALFLPIRRTARTLGLMLMESPAEDAFPRPQVEFLERLSAHAAIAIANAQLYAEVRGANQAKSEFISFVAHELKTPMTSIRGYTDLVAQGAVGPVTQPQANFLATIRLNVDRMAALVSDLNDVSRIESGRLKLEFAAVPIAPALDEVLEALQSQIDGKEQKLALEIPVDLPPAWVDRGRLIQILTNLLSNAHKYTPGGGSLRIAVEQTPNRWDSAGPPEVIHFLIQDSGLGISAQEQNSIFQKFFRSEDGTVRDLPGTGLGLHITRNLVEMHGGRIWFESEFRRGSTFHFTVPAASL
jgi:signal transduction histidine kinase